MRRAMLLIGLLSTLSGCTHIALRNDTVKTTNTLSIARAGHIDRGVSDRRAQNRSRTAVRESNTETVLAWRSHIIGNHQSGMIPWPPVASLTRSAALTM